MATYENTMFVFIDHLGMCAKLMFTFACVSTHVQVPSSCLQLCGHMEKEHVCKWSCMQSLCSCLQVCGHVCRIHVRVYRYIEPMCMFTGVCGHVYRAHVHLCGCPLSVLPCMVPLSVPLGPCCALHQGDQGPDLPPACHPISAEEHFGDLNRSSDCRTWACPVGHRQHL